MTGIVVIWPFTIATIPAGWLLCDGTQGTPDMRGYVAIGARDGFDSGAILGSDTHVHAMSYDTAINNTNHTHNYYGESAEPSSGSFNHTEIGGIYDPYDEHSHAFSGVTGTNLTNHTHTINDITGPGSSKQLCREILFIMKE